MAKIGRKVRDKGVLKLIGSYLRAPMERDGQADQAKPRHAARRPGLSPLLAKQLKLRVNPTKRGTGRPWHGKFLGFRITSDGSLKLAQASLEKLKDQARKCWNNQNRQALEERIEEWRQYIRGWYAYFGACIKYPLTRATEGWIRRHMRKYFWQRWHNKRCRMNALKRLKAKSYHQRQTSVSVGAWRMARNPMLHTVLNNARLKRWGLWLPSDFVTT